MCAFALVQMTSADDIKTRVERMVRVVPTYSVMSVDETLGGHVVRIAALGTVDTAELNAMLLAEFGRSDITCKVNNGYTAPSPAAAADPQSRDAEVLPCMEIELFFRRALPGISPVSRMRCGKSFRPIITAVVFLLHSIAFWQLYSMGGGRVHLMEDLAAPSMRIFIVVVSAYAIALFLAPISVTIQAITLFAVLINLGTCVLSEQGLRCSHGRPPESPSNRSIALCAAFGLTTLRTLYAVCMDQL